jgi:hypothetical protein
MKAYGGVDVHIHVFFTSVLVEREWSASRSCRFTPRGKSPRYPLARKLDGLQSRSGRHGEVKILDPIGTRKPVASCYTDWAVPALTEETGPVVMLQLCIREVFGSNLGQNIKCSEGFSWFSSASRGKFRDSIMFRYDAWPFSSKSCPIHQPSYHPTLCNLVSQNNAWKEEVPAANTSHCDERKWFLG